MGFWWGILWGDEISARVTNPQYDNKETNINLKSYSNKYASRVWYKQYKQSNEVLCKCSPTIYPTSRYRHLDSKLWGQLQFIFNLFHLWSFQRYSWIAAVIVATAESPPCSVTPSASARALNEGSRRFPENFTITEKAPVRAISWLKAPTSAFTFKALLRHCQLC